MIILQRQDKSNIELALSNINFICVEEKNIDVSFD